MNIDRAVSIVLACCAILIAGTMVQRQFGAGTRKNESITDARVTAFSQWSEVQSAGRLLGPEGAKVQIVEFSDLECPFCKRFHRALGAVRSKYSADVSLRFVHFPLSMHKFARQAASAAECAHEQGRFGEFIESVFEDQDSLGLRSWGSFAAGAAVADTVRLVTCVRDAVYTDAVDSASRMAERFGVQSTPTVVINGWRLAIPPTEPQLLSIVAEVLDGANAQQAALNAMGTPQ